MSVLVNMKHVEYMFRVVCLDWMLQCTMYALSVLSYSEMAV